MARKDPAASPARKAESKAKSPPGGLSPAQLALVHHLGKEAPKWRDTLEVGNDQPVDVIVWLRGRLNVGENDFRIATSTPELVEVLEFALAWLGPKTREELRGQIVAAFKDGRRPASNDPEIKQLAIGTVELITVREQKTKRGDVKCHDVDLVVLPRSAAGAR